MTRCASRSTALPSWTFQSNSAARLATRRSFAWLSLTTSPPTTPRRWPALVTRARCSPVCLATVLCRAPRLVPTRTTSRASPESASADTRRISFSRRRPTCLRLLHSRTSTRSARRPLRVPTSRSLLPRRAVVDKDYESGVAALGMRFSLTTMSRPMSPFDVESQDMASKPHSGSGDRDGPFKFDWPIDWDNWPPRRNKPPPPPPLSPPPPRFLARTPFSRGLPCSTVARQSPSTPSPSRSPWSGRRLSRAPRFDTSSATTSRTNPSRRLRSAVASSLRLSGSSSFLARERMNSRSRRAASP